MSPRCSEKEQAFPEEAVFKLKTMIMVVLARYPALFEAL